MRASHTALTVCALALVLTSTEALSCSMLSYNVDDARTKLRRAANESDFENAKVYARRAKSALDDTAMSAMNCQCQMAYSEFDTAASRARRASNADSPDEFVESLNRAIRAFNDAIRELQSCAAQRR